MPPFHLCTRLNPTVPGVVTGCLVKETLKAGSSLRGDGYILLRIKKPAPQQNNTPIISSTLSDKKQRTSQTFQQPNIHQEQKESAEEGGWRKRSGYSWVSILFGFTSVQRNNKALPLNVRMYQHVCNTLSPPHSFSSFFVVSGTCFSTNAMFDYYCSHGNAPISSIWPPLGPTLITSTSA